jgi:hypothetical protein
MLAAPQKDLLGLAAPYMGLQSQMPLNQMLLQIQTA